MQYKHIFLTGGTGFFGKSILDWLKRNGQHPHLTVLSRSPEAFVKNNPQFADTPNLSFVEGDIRTFVFPSGYFDCVIHGATEASVTVPDEEMRSVILGGTRRVLDFAKQCGCSRLLFISSGGVYGEQIAPIAETSVCNPSTAYGKGKLEAEQMCIESGVPSLLARCFAFVGPYLNLDIHFAIGNFIRDCLADRPIIIKGDGTPLRSYLYADDLVEWLFAIVERGEIERAYNVGSPVAVSIKELAEIVRTCIGTKNEIRVLGTPDMALPPSCYVPQIHRIQNELAVSLKVPLDEAIIRSI